MSLSPQVFTTIQFHRLQRFIDWSHAVMVSLATIIVLGILTALPIGILMYFVLR